jgi:hypothetical protein
MRHVERLAQLGTGMEIVFPFWRILPNSKNEDQYVSIIK